VKNSPGGSDKATESGIPYLQDDELAGSDDLVGAIRALLPERQVVELAGTIACYNMVSRFVVATGIGLE
jgi:hypothetical protein